VLLERCTWLPLLLWHGGTPGRQHGSWIQVQYGTTAAQGKHMLQHCRHLSAAISINQVCVSPCCANLAVQVLPRFTEPCSAKVNHLHDTMHT
jgi:hypothetical protein